MRLLKKWLFKQLMKLAWKLSEDAMMSYYGIDELYNNVPYWIRKQSVQVYEFHIFKEGATLEHSLKWLNED